MIILIGKCMRLVGVLLQQFIAKEIGFLHPMLGLEKRYIYISSEIAGCKIKFILFYIIVVVLIINIVT